MEKTTRIVKDGIHRTIASSRLPEYEARGFVEVGSKPDSDDPKTLKAEIKALKKAVTAGVEALEAATAKIAELEGQLAEANAEIEELEVDEK